MSRILVVEPSKMLQQALVFALASEHQIQVTDRLPRSDAAPEVDVAIVDRAAVRDEDADKQELGAMREWRIPIVWLGAEWPAAGGSAPGNIVRVALPLDLESLKKALADVFAAQQAAQTGTLNSPTAAVFDPERSKRKKTESSPTAGENRETIELVEVIEEQPAGALSKTEAGKKS